MIAPFDIIQYPEACACTDAGESASELLERRKYLDV
jgi:hypothetical protein